ncbi:hypothetical protein B0H17DRAFT_1279703 [Mycena rosella]|uniref:Uncharacterized protein n=1 Tax=Mycena rosella TaxID=1033263 RepID=A0AAD7FPI9_MYCRO|nr:hypothetical protein B0H17DRAFT_1279703 [Mycena rosella]
MRSVHGAQLCLLARCIPPTPQALAPNLDSAGAPRPLEYDAACAHQEPTPPRRRYTHGHTHSYAQSLRAHGRAQRRSARKISSARLEARSGTGDKEEESKETIDSAGRAFPSGKNEVKSRDAQQKNGSRSIRQPPGNVKRGCDDQREPPLTKAPLRYRHVRANSPRVPCKTNTGAGAAPGVEWIVQAKQGRRGA